MEVEVIRSPGIRRGDDVQDPLLATREAAIERGKVVIDESTQADIISLECRHTDAMPGDLVRVTDGVIGRAYVAKVRSVRHTRTLATARTALELWRPRQ